jgi:hypothetical protein
MIFAALLIPQANGTEDKIGLEEGRFDIRVDGREIGSEKFSIAYSADSASSTSVLDFRDPAGGGRMIHIETQLDMNGRYVPRAYQLSLDLEGRKESLTGKFSPGQVLLRTKRGGNSRESGLLVGNRYFVLDTNVFHHFIFIARLFDFDAGEKPQSFEVIVPQEMQNGFLSVSHAGMNKIQVQGKKRNLHHLKVDSGLLLIDLWVDDQRILYKISLAGKQIEVVRY